jgi:hypothetical protein
VNTPLPLINDELDLLSRLLPLEGLRIIELGCGGATPGASLLQVSPTAQVTGLEVDARQHAKNLAAPLQGPEFCGPARRPFPCPTPRSTWR